MADGTLEGETLDLSAVETSEGNKKSARTLASAKRKRVEAANNAHKLPRIMANEDAFFKRMTDYMDNKFGGVNERLEEVSSTVAKNSKEISTLKKQVEEIQSGASLEKKVEEMVKKSIEKQAPPASRINKDMRRVENEMEKIKALQLVRSSDKKDTSQEERHYWWSRRAVRIWPVKGSTSQELWKETGEFFFNILDVPKTNLSEDSVENVRRIFPTRSRGNTRTKVRDEVRVLFKDIETRDMIYSYAPNLAERRNEAGMRLEIPGHLLGQFKTLEKYGRQLKSTRGQLRESR